MRREQDAKGRKRSEGGLVRVAAEAVRPASEPLALLYRILGPGPRPSRHSRGTVDNMRPVCHTRGLAALKVAAAASLHIFDGPARGRRFEVVKVGGSEGNSLVVVWARDFGENYFLSDQAFRAGRKLSPTGRRRPPSRVTEAVPASRICSVATM